MQLILNSYGLQISKKDQCFWIEKGKMGRLIAPKRIDSILITHACLISSDVILLAVENEIPIILLDKTGKPKARLWSPDFPSMAEIRKKQARHCESLPANKFVTELFKLKLLGQLSNLEYLKRKRHKCKKLIEDAIGKINNYTKESKYLVIGKLMEKEGQISKVYWGILSKVMNPYTVFNKRSRRPALDPFNAAINYAYGILYSIVETAIINAGLDPEIGIFHKDQYNRPVLAFDLIEPYRPWTDKVVMSLFFGKLLKDGHFENKEGGYWLSSLGKAVLIPEINAYLEEKNYFNKRRIKRRDQIFYKALELSQLFKNINY